MCLLFANSVRHAFNACAVDNQSFQAHLCIQSGLCIRIGRSIIYQQCGSCGSSDLIGLKQFPLCCTIRGTNFRDVISGQGTSLTYIHIHTCNPPPASCGLASPQTLGILRKRSVLVVLSVSPCTTKSIPFHVVAPSENLQRFCSRNVILLVNSTCFENKHRAQLGNLTSDPTTIPRRSSRDLITSRSKSSRQPHLLPTSSDNLITISLCLAPRKAVSDPKRS